MTPIFVRRYAASAVLFLVATLSAPMMAHGEVFKKGSFTKSTVTAGCPAACTNVVAHGLGETPKALILWTSGKTNESFSSSFLYAFGMTDGTASRSAAAASQDAASNPNSSRRMANAALTIVEWAEVTRAEATLQSWDNTNFTLQWTPNNATGYVIHYIAIGGGNVSAKVIDWQMPTATGIYTNSSVGFEPDVVLHAHAGDSFTGAFGTSAVYAQFGFGVMTAHGDEWSNSFLSHDAGGAANTQRGQQTDSCIFAFDGGLAVTKEASFDSMTSTGFKVNFTTANVNAGRIFSLALKGVSVRAAKFAKSVAAQPASQTVADVGFKPDLVLLSSMQDVVQANPVAATRFGIGASDGTTEGSVALQDHDPADPTTTDGISKTSKVFVKVNNNTPAINAEADLTGFFNGGFVLNWTTNDAVATEILYLAFGKELDAKVLSGSYMGDGVDDRQIDVGFVPDFVILKAATAQVGVFRTSTMGADESKLSTGVSSPGLLPDLIQSFDSAGGFTVGTDARVNANGVMYYWTAFRAGAGKMVVGSYTGDGSATPPPIVGSAIDALGFSPDLVFVLSEGTAAGHESIHRSSASNATGGFDFDFSGAIANTVTLGTDGFTLGADSHVNASGTVYHYVAWNEVAGYMDVGTYAGDAAPTRDITTPGFAPEHVILKRIDNGGIAYQRRASLIASDQDSSEYLRADPTLCCRILKLLSTGFQVNQQYNTNSSGGQYFYYAWKRESQPVIVTGSYDGTGAALSVTELGFDPDFVIVKQSTGGTNRIAVARAQTAMANGKEMTGATALTAQTITSLTASNGGFTVGTSALVNTSGVTHHFIAFKAAPGTMKVGRYQGNGTSVAITGMNFSPELVFIFPEGAQTPIHYSSANTAEFYDFAAGAGTAAAGVIALNADGFTVSTANTSVNANTVWYNYVAWNEIPGEMQVSSYVAPNPAVDNTSITGIGFEPEYVIVKHTNSFHTVHHPASLGRSVDQTLYFNALVQTPADIIQSLVPDGFTIGFDFQAQQPAQTYVYYAWKRPYMSALTAVGLTTLTATRYDRGVLVNWRTGYEIDNLGFHVYREIGGERTRINRSTIAGSGLMAGQGTAVNAEQRYATWDLDTAAADRSAVYWLEDLDFNGVSTWHGPVTPVDGGLQAPPDIVTSSGLGDLAKAAKRQGKAFVDRGANVERPRKSDSPAPRSKTDPALAAQRLIAGQAAVKIGIKRTGWYRVGQPELLAAGLDPLADPHKLQLYVEGIEQAITVTGAADGRFDAGDAIEFYGVGLDTPYSDTRTYWLITGGRAGRRVTIHPAPERGTRSIDANNFTFTVQQKERSIYFAALRNGDNENWFGSFIYEEPTDLTVNVTNVDTTRTAELEIALQGVTELPDDLDHRVGILVNGTEVGEVVFDGQSLGVETFTIPAATLIDGANTITAVARGGEGDYSLVDIMRLRYAHLYRADADLLRFSAEGPGGVTVSGFGQSAIRVIDVTDPLAPEEVSGSVSADAGLWSVTTRLPGSGDRTLLSFTDMTIGTPAFVGPNALSRWSAASNGADYIAVTHSQFAGSIAPLLQRRAESGLSVARIDIEDVYDEFSFGEKTPQALKDFVSHARATWKTAPRFLVLVGDATLDPRDYAGFGDADFVPSKQIPMVQVALETVSDEWFADADEDGLPELAVGRLSARTPAHADAMVAKILAYEDGDAAHWTHNVLLVAGENDEGGDFAQSTAALETMVPSTHTVRRVISGVSGAEVARHELREGINEGQLIVNYIGHGSVRIWGREALLTSDDVAGWQNAGRLPLVVAMNCLNGFFHGIYDEESLAETLLRASGGGAVAAWASSGVTESKTQERVNRELYRLLFNDASLTIGQAAILAKRVVSDRDIRRSWIFFGDPALRLKGIIATADSSTESTSRTTVIVALASSSPAGTSQTVKADVTHRLSDWNGDGRADVFLHANSGWRALLSAPKGEFVRTGQWNAAWEVYPADLNGDHVEDMVLIDRSAGTMLHAVNDGNGNFAYQQDMIGSQWQVQVADLNGDALDDLLLTMPENGFWYTLLNDGKGHFSYRAGSWVPASSVTVGDFNGDSRADAFAYDRFSGAWTVASSNGAGDFTYLAGQTAPGMQVQRADVNGDTRADLLLYDVETGVWAELASQSHGGFGVQAGVWRTGLSVRAIASQGRDDVLLYSDETGEWTLITHDKGSVKHLAGVWRPHLTIAAGDLDGDGRTDLLLYDPASGEWQRGMRNKVGGFDFSSGVWEAGWSLASRP